jgi:putative SOS response-associated peptidase YedK
MCGRFAQTKALVDLLNKYRFLVADNASLGKRYNVAPMQMHPVFAAQGLMPMRWGLVPHWAKDAGMGAKLINARSETLQEKPSFREAFKKRRCLVPATGFYEWKKEGGGKTPYSIGLADCTPFVFAGLWEHWASPAEGELHTFTIVTTEANTLVRPIHDRMPVILAPRAAELWLDGSTKINDAQAVLQPYPAGEMEAHPVSHLVNSTKNDSVECLEAAQEAQQGELF